MVVTLKCAKISLPSAQTIVHQTSRVVAHNRLFEGNNAALVAGLFGG